MQAQIAHTHTATPCPPGYLSSLAILPRQACGEIAVMFQSDPGPVQAAAMHPQATVKERANRVLRQLLGDSAGAAAPQAAAAAHARQQALPPPPQQSNLVDLLGRCLHLFGTRYRNGLHSTEWRPTDYLPALRICGLQVTAP